MESATNLTSGDLEYVKEITQYWNHEDERTIARLTNFEQNGMHIFAFYRFAYKHRRNHLINVPLEYKFNVQFTFHWTGSNRKVAWRIDPPGTKYLTIDKWFGQDVMETKPRIR